MNSQTAPASGEAFRGGFERCTIPNEAFRHRDHIRLAWIYLRDSDLDGVIKRITESIRRFADHHGASGRYHETLTQAWARIVALAIAATPRAARVDELLAAHPHLLDKGLPLRHFSGTLLGSDAARRQWVEPDLRAFPGP